MYGFFVSAPMGHFFVGLLQRAFAGRTSTGAKIAQILASNLLIAPITCSGEFANVRDRTRLMTRVGRSVPCFHGYCKWC